METLTSNQANEVRRETLHGRDYLVAPLTLIVPGVLNGSKGPLYYPAEEIEKNPSVWNHMPIVVNHPLQDGIPVSARYPAILNEYGIGVVLNATAKDSKLVAEGWFDIDQTRKVDERIYASLAVNSSLELSTGLFPSFEKAPDGATFNGSGYDFIARNYQPDHLAILPDEIGACSIADGCGVLVNTINKVTDLNDGVGLLLNQPSHDALRDKLNKLVQKSYGESAWVTEVFNSYLIYEMDNKYYRAGYSVDMRTNDKIELLNQSPVEVVRIVTYRNVTNNNSNNRRSTMTLSAEQKNEMVTDLISNACCWKEDDRNVLTELADETLVSLVDNAKESKVLELVANAATEGFKDTLDNLHKFNTETGKWDTISAKEPVVNVPTKDDKPKTLDEFLADAPAEVQSVVQNALRIEASQKAEIIKRLVANVNETDKASALQDRLQNKSLEELQDMELLIPKDKTVTNNYVGAAGGTDTTNDKSEVGEPLPMPTINWADDK